MLGRSSVYGRSNAGGTRHLFHQGRQHVLDHPARQATPNVTSHPPPRLRRSADDHHLAPLAPSAPHMKEVRVKKCNYRSSLPTISLDNITAIKYTTAADARHGR